MLRQGVATMILESPYYGSRRPPYQEGSKLKRVSDLLTLGRATIEESLYLLAWAQRQDFRHLGEALTQMAAAPDTSSSGKESSRARQAWVLVA